MKWPGKALVGLCISFLFFFSVEAIQRIRYSQANRAFKNWQNRFIYPPENSLGFRGSEIRVKKEPHTLRILFVGGSTTFGIYNPVEETFPYLTKVFLEKKLPGTSVEVINAARCGLTSSGEVSRIREMLYLQPDLAVIMTGYNDALALLYRDCVEIDRRGNLHVHSWYLKLNVFLASHSVAYVTLREKLATILHGTPVAAFDCYPNPQLWYRYQPEAFERNLHRMIQIVRQYDIKPVFIKAPLSDQRRQQSPIYMKAYLVLNKILEDFCVQQHVLMLDLTEEDWDIKAKEYFHSDGLHFTKAGNLLIASRLSDFLGGHLPSTLRATSR